MVRFSLSVPTFADASPGWTESLAAAPLVISLDDDTGVSDTDNITRTGALVFSDPAPGATRLIIVNGSFPSATYTPPTTDGTYTVTVIDFDAATGAVSTGSLTFTLDTSPPAAPTVALTEDTGVAGDNVTLIEGFEVGNIEAGGSVEYRIDGGDWTATEPTGLAAGAHVVEVRVVDVAGNASDPTVLEFTLERSLDQQPPEITLVNDTGRSATDLVTRDPTLEFSAPASGVTRLFVVNDAPPSDVYVPPSEDGTYVVTVIDYDGDGNVRTDTIRFVLDTSPPLPPSITLAEDSGTPGDNVTSVEGFLLEGVEAGATVEYRLDSGEWTTEQPSGLASGPHVVEVRVTDAAGNVSDTTMLSFTLELTDEQQTPTVALANDSGARGDDGVTNDPSVEVGNIRVGNSAQYSIDGGVTWLDALPDDIVDGVVTIQVRQVDGGGAVVGNVAEVTFELDRTAPGAVTVDLSNDTGTPNDNVTSDFTFDLTGVEQGALVEYTFDGGVTWITAPPDDLADGRYTVGVRQTDLAGNRSSVTEFEFDYDGDATPPDPTDGLTTGQPLPPDSNNGVIGSNTMTFNDHGMW